jgi:hypothetical protein
MIDATFAGGCVLPSTQEMTFPHSVWVKQHSLKVQSTPTQSTSAFSGFGNPLSAIQLNVEHVFAL